MENPTIYTMLTLLDEPRRHLSLTIDELVVAGSGLLLLVCSSQKIMVSVVGSLLFESFRRLKKGGGPRVLLVLAYWHLPHALTQLIVPTLPASHRRVWIA